MGMLETRIYTKEKLKVKHNSTHTCLSIFHPSIFALPHHYLASHIELLKSKLKLKQLLFNLVRVRIQ